MAMSSGKYFTYCTKCRTNVEISSIKYIRLANSRVAIEGFCPLCNVRLLKGKVMPRSSKMPIKRKKKLF